MINLKYRITYDVPQGTMQREVYALNIFEAIKTFSENFPGANITEVIEI